MDWREAARLLDELAALEEGQGEAGDLFDVLRQSHGMKAEGRSVVWDYWDRQQRGDPYIAYANGYILKQVGTAGYAAFSLVIAQQRPLSGLSATEEASALRALAEAVNALCNFHRRFRQEKSLAATKREMARLAAGA